MTLTPPTQRFQLVQTPGQLCAGVWEPEGEPEGTIVAIHGITATHKAWLALARMLPQWRIIAPDLRGRGGSNHLPGPYGMARHADDVAALLAHMGVTQVLPVGHSMGAFVSVVLAHRHPHLMERLVLVDGGIPLEIPEGVAPQTAIEAVLGPAAQRLSMTFASVEEYTRLWKNHPALGDWNSDLAEYVAYDVQGQAPHLRATTQYEAMAEDTRDVTGEGTALTDALDAVTLPMLLLRAERGMLDQPEGLYADKWLQRWEQRVPSLKVRNIPGVNHYTIAMREHGAREVAKAVRNS